MKCAVIIAVLAALTACTPVRMVGNAAIGAGQVVLGAADVVI
jgi:hypothetical protein